MKVVQINVVCNGSTGKIMCDLAKELEIKGHESYIFFGRGNPKNNLNCKKIENKFSIYFHVLLGRIGLNGHGSYFATKKLVRELKRINPDVIHLHNIHGYYINLKVLFKYLKKNYKGKIVWTLHDCWTFTGHCSYFTISKCDKWETECNKCPNLNCYPKELIDTTKKEFRLKKSLFTDLNDLTITTPSNWLKGLVKKSFLKKYDIKVINNGIDLDIFKPTKNEKIFEKYNIPKDKKIILGVANIWEERKGLKIFSELASIIKKDEVIVLVGLTEKQIEELPKNIVGIKRTENQKELANIYTIADIFINPSIEETFSLVTVEAMACGQQVIVCGTSAPKELIDDNIGITIDDNKAINYYNAYKKIKKKEISQNEIVKYAKKYSNEHMLKEIIEVYGVK